MRALSELGFCHGGDDVHLSLGQLVCGDYDLYTIAFTITFSLLFVAELILRSIEALAENTAYQVMVQKIFKESKYKYASFIVSACYHATYVPVLNNLEHAGWWAFSDCSRVHNTRYVVVDALYKFKRSAHHS